MRVCVTFNPSTCPWTTGYHILDAFSRLTEHEVVHAEPHTAHEVDADLYMFVDSGHPDSLHTPPHKTIFYSIDSYLRGTRDIWYFEMASRVKWVFDVTRAGQKWFKEQGVNVLYSPLAFNDKIYYHEDDMYEMEVKPFDVCFVGGRKDEGKRKEILDIVGDNFSLSTPVVWAHGIRELINLSKCFLDIPPMESDLQGQRFYEGLGCYANMVTLERPSIQGLEETNLFYYNLEDLEGSLTKAISKAIVSERKIPTGPSSHTYVNRLKDIMKIVETTYET